jgi:hypothetical protein
MEVLEAVNDYLYAVLEDNVPITDWEYPKGEYISNKLILPCVGCHDGGR